MKKTILNTLFFLIAITAQAQLTDWQNISSKNFVTNGKNEIFSITLGYI